MFFGKHNISVSIEPGDDGHLTVQRGTLKSTLPMHGKQDMPKGTMEGHCQVELRVADVVQNLFRVGRHLLQAAHHRLLRDRPFRLWDELTCAC